LKILLLCLLSLAFCASMITYYIIQYLKLKKVEKLIRQEQQHLLKKLGGKKT